MHFVPTSLPGAFIIRSNPVTDDRGSFWRTCCEDEFRVHGINTRWPQSSASLTKYKGTIRGLHFQSHPHQECKLIRCTSGRIWDVAVNIDPASEAFGRWESFVLCGEKSDQLYLPTGYAHGFQSLEDNCSLTYSMSVPFAPAFSTGIRWNDPTLAIPWPLPDPLLSEKDRNLPFLAPGSKTLKGPHRP